MDDAATKKEKRKLKKTGELRKKSQFLYHTIRPLVECILEDYTIPANTTADVRVIEPQPKRNRISDQIQYFPLNIKKTEKVLKLYNTLKAKNPIVMQSNLLRNLENFETNGCCNGKLWDEINSMTLEIYMKRSHYVRDTLIEIVDIIEKNDREISDLNYRKNSLLSDIFKYNAPVYSYTKLHKTVVKLIKCEKIEDYKKNYRRLKNFIANKSIEGYFMNNVLPENNADEKDKEIEKKEREKDYNRRKTR